ncbi:hypothetical protein LCGC14_2308580, partial [marine sediment metagenome]
LFDNLTSAFAFHKIILDDYLSDDFVLWGLKDRINYFESFSSFLKEEVRNGDSPKTIKRRILLKNLSV